MNDLPLYPAADIGAVEEQFFTLRNFPLTDGTVMPQATIAYETYGRLAPDATLSSARMATPAATTSPAVAWQTATSRARETA